MERKKFEGETIIEALEKASEYFERPVEELAYEKVPGMLSFLGKGKDTEAIKVWVKAEEEEEDAEENEREEIAREEIEDDRDSDYSADEEESYTARESDRDTDYDEPRERYEDHSRDEDVGSSDESSGYPDEEEEEEESESSSATSRINVQAADLDTAITKAARELGCEVAAVQYRKLPALAWLGQSGKVVRISAWCAQDDAGSVDYPEEEEADTEPAEDSTDEKQEETKTWTDDDDDDDDDFASDPRLAELGPVGIKAFEHAKKIAAAICPGAEIEISENDDEISINLNGSEADILLSEEADPLDAFQYLVARLVGTDSERHKRIRVNVDDYRQMRASELIKTAHALAKQAIEEDCELATEPLNPQERRLVHLTLADVPGIVTESRGDEQRKRVYLIPE